MLVQLIYLNKEHFTFLVDIFIKRLTVRMPVYKDNGKLS